MAVKREYVRQLIKNSVAWQNVGQYRLVHKAARNWQEFLKESAVNDTKTNESAPKVVDVLSVEMNDRKMARNFNVYNTETHRYKIWRQDNSRRTLENQRVSFSSKMRTAAVKDLIPLDEDTMEVLGRIHLDNNKLSPITAEASAAPSPKSISLDQYLKTMRSARKYVPPKVIRQSLGETLKELTSGKPITILSKREAEAEMKTNHTATYNVTKMNEQSRTNMFKRPFSHKDEEEQKKYKQKATYNVSTASSHLRRTTHKDTAKANPMRMFPSENEGVEKKPKPKTWYERRGLRSSHRPTKDFANPSGQSRIDTYREMAEATTKSLFSNRNEGGGKKSKKPKKGKAIKASEQPQKKTDKDKDTPIANPERLFSNKSEEEEMRPKQKAKHNMKKASRRETHTDTATEPSKRSFAKKNERAETEPKQMPKEKNRHKKSSRIEDDEKNQDTEKNWEETPYNKRIQTPEREVTPRVLRKIKRTATRLSTNLSPIQTLYKNKLISPPRNHPMRA